MTTTALTTLREAGFSVAITPAGKLAITPASKLTPEMRGFVTTHRDDLVQLLGRAASNDPSSSQPVATAPAPANFAKRVIHPSLLTGASGKEIDTMVARMELFESRGLVYDDAGRLTDKLLVRDRERENWGACAECAHLQGSGPAQWTCGDRATGHCNQQAGTRLGAAIVHFFLHSCKGYEPAT